MHFFYSFQGQLFCQSWWVSSSHITLLISLQASDFDVSVHLGFKRCFELCITGGQRSFPCFGAWVSPTWSWLQDSAVAGKDFQIWWEAFISSFFARSATLPVCSFFGEACYSEATSTGKECSLFSTLLGLISIQPFWIGLVVYADCLFLIRCLRSIRLYELRVYLSWSPSLNSQW